MNFSQMLYNVMSFLSFNLVEPINYFLNGFGVDVTHLDQLILNFGFGELTWISINAFDLLLILIGLLVSITALVLTWKFIKFLNGFLKGLFTGIKR